MRLLGSMLVLAATAGADPGIHTGGEGGHRLHIDVDAGFTYAFAPPLSGFGFVVGGTGGVPVWNTRRGTGTIDLGVELGY